MAGPSGGGRWRRGQAPFRGDTRREARAHAGSRAGPRGAARGREARCRRSWYRWARPPNPTGGRRGPENAPSQLRCARFHGDAAPVSAPKLSGEQRPSRLNPPLRHRGPPSQSAGQRRTPARGPRGPRGPLSRAEKPVAHVPDGPDGALRGGGVGGSRAAGRGGSGSGRARPTRRCKAGASECRARAARPAASLSAVTPMCK